MTLVVLVSLTASSSSDSSVSSRMKILRVGEAWDGPKILLSNKAMFFNNQTLVLPISNCCFSVLLVVKLKNYFMMENLLVFLSLLNANCFYSLNL